MFAQSINEIEIRCSKCGAVNTVVVSSLEFDSAVQATCHVCSDPLSEWRPMVARLLRQRETEGER